MINRFTVFAPAVSVIARNPSIDDELNNSVSHKIPLNRAESAAVLYICTFSKMIWIWSNGICNNGRPLTAIGVHPRKNVTQSTGRRYAFLIIHLNIEFVMTICQTNEIVRSVSGLRHTHTCDMHNCTCNYIVTSRGSPKPEPDEQITF